MSGIVVSLSLSGALHKLNSLLNERPSSTNNILKDEIKQIVATLQAIAQGAEDAEQQATTGNEIVKAWLEELQEVLYAVDDVIDEMQYTMSRSYDNHQIPHSNQVSSSISRFLKRTSPPKSKLALSLHNILLGLDKLEQDRIRFPSPSSVHKLRAGAYQVRGPEDELIKDTEQIVGRQNDMEEVIDLILKSAHGVAVVPIIGFIGIGKTTLARLVYLSRSLLKDHFDNSLWMELGEYRGQMGFWKSLNDVHIANDIWGEDEWDLKQLKVGVQKFLKDRRVLIVLDGFKDESLHNSLARELIDMLSLGSAILLTTRSRRAAALIATTPAYRLQPLSPEDSYQLFTQFAFTSSMEHQDPEYKRIGLEFVKLCSGVPMLLKRIASIAYDMETPTEWSRCLDGLRDHKEDFVLYDALYEIPSHLKLPIQCFRLQKTCGLGVEPLTRVWMALGFLFSDDATQSPEYIARKYLKEVVDSALCPDVEYAPGGVVRHIKYNDALCDFTAAIGHGSWVIARGGDKKFYSSPTYIIWDQDCLRVTPDCVRKQKTVRLFMVCAKQRASVQFVTDVVSYFPCLRVLGVGGCDVEMLPYRIGDLRHLRYLDAGRNPRMKILPDSICDLWFLQTLCLEGCFQLQELPANIGRLRKLRYLTLTFVKESLPEEIGQLTSLRTLGLTGCPCLSSLPSTIKNLKKLRTFAIVNCPELDLAAGSTVEAFKGLDSMQTLLLSNLPKFAGFPSDLGNPSLALGHLQILLCTSLTETKWIAQFRSLRSLTIEVCPKLLDLKLTDGGSQLGGLSELVIRRCPNLGTTKWITQCVSLRSLVIDACHKLVELDAGFSELKNLERLEIRRCPGLTKWFAGPAGKDWRQNVRVRTFVGMFLI